MKKIVLVALIALLSFTAFSQEKSSPTVQTSFLGLSFGDAQAKVYDKLYSDGYDIIEGPLNTFIVKSVYFGGSYWSFCSFGFAKESLISFSAFQNFPKDMDFQVLFDDLLKNLQRKYPMKQLLFDNSCFYYKDTAGNSISLYHKESSIVLSYKSCLEEQKKREELDEL